jgi:glyoxylase-like metal-dependent hydrolase (beta-lactamase superfamily II)
LTRLSALRQGSSRYSTPMRDSIEHAFASARLPAGVRRLTFPLPTGPRHVHSYLLRSESDGWLLVDTGLGLPADAHPWTEVVASLDGPLEAIVVTHFHPDHVGGAERAAGLTGAPVYQGALDYAQCERVWGSSDWPDRIAAWFLLHGVPRAVTDELIQQGHAYAPFIRFAPDPHLVYEGDRVGGWEIVELPGHADGHIGLLRDGVLAAGDHLLPRITPAVGLYPESRSDPLGDYLRSLERTAMLDVRVALPGHGDPVEDPAGRAREIVEHHRERLDEIAGVLDARPRTGYEVSLAVFGAALSPTQRRFAVAETLSHLERLVREGRAARDGDGDTITYTGS